MFRHSVIPTMEKTRRRIRVNRTIRWSLTALNATAWGTLAVLLADRLAQLRPVHIESLAANRLEWIWAPIAGVAMTAITAVIAWVLRVPSVFQMAVRTDDILDLKTCLSTALAMPDGSADDTILKRIRRDADRQAHAIDPSRIVPLTFDRRHVLLVLPLTAILFIHFLVDQKDLLGIAEKKRRAANTLAINVESVKLLDDRIARQQLKLDTRSAANQPIPKVLGDVMKSATKLAQASKNTLQNADHNTVAMQKKIALKELEDAREKIRTAKAEYEKAQAISEAMDKLRDRDIASGQTQSPASDIRDAMADSQFRNAAKHTRRLKNKLKQRKKNGSWDLDKLKQTAADLERQAKSLEKADPELADTMRAAADQLKNDALEYEQMQAVLTPDELEAKRRDMEKKIDESLDDLANKMDDMGDLGDLTDNLDSLDDVENVLDDFENSLTGNAGGKIAQGARHAGRGKRGRADRLKRLGARSNGTAFGGRTATGGRRTGGRTAMGGRDHGSGGVSHAPDDTEGTDFVNMGLEGDMKSNKVIAINAFRGIGKAPDDYSESLDVNAVRRVTDAEASSLENTYIPERQKEMVKRYFESLEKTLP